MKANRLTVLFGINKLIIGGAEQQLLELVKGIDKKSFKIIVVTLYPGGDLEPEIQSTLDIEYYCLNRKNKYDFSTLLDIYSLLKEKQVDIVQPFLTPSTFFFLLPSILRRVPVRIVTERGNLRENAGRGYNLYLKTEDFLTRFTERVIPNSKSGANYLQSRGIKPEKIRVIYNGINTKRLVPNPERVRQIRSSLRLPENGVVIGINATLIPIKDHATFLQAARLVSESYPQARFGILGDGPLRDELGKLAHNLGISSSVTFWGNQVDVSSYLEAMDIVCLSSSGPEGCSNAILEAMALGKPVVATDMGGNVELVEDGENGIIVPSQNPHVMADAMISCIKDPARARRMGKRGREIVKTRFGLQRMINDYEVLYRETSLGKTS